MPCKQETTIPLKSDRHVMKYCQGSSTPYCTKSQIADRSAFNSPQGLPEECFIRNAHIEFATSIVTSQRFCPLLFVHSCFCSNRDRNEPKSDHSDFKSKH